jgi:predicted acetyltransferase
MAALELKVPSLELLPGFVEALQRGWSRDNIALEKAIAADLERIAEDAAAFVASLDDVEARGAPIELPDGSRVPRLPGYYRWLWDGEFCGSIGFRWQPGTSELPAHVFGHIGYGVVPWKRGRGYATRAVALLLPEARAMGMAYVELTTDEDNLASRRTITANGGELVEMFAMPAAYGGEGHKLRYRIAL